MLGTGLTIALLAGGGLLLVALLALHRHRQTIQALDGKIRRLRKTLADMQETQADYRLMFKHAPVACMTWEPGFRVVDWNDAAERTFGWSRKEIRGRSLLETLVPAHERGQLLHSLSAQAVGDDRTEITMQNLTRAGDTLNCVWRHVLQRRPGKMRDRIVSLCIRADKTGELATENALFRSVVELTNDPAIMLHDPAADGRIIFATDAACRHFGRSQMELLGSSALDWDAHFDSKQLGEVVETILSGKTLTMETRHRHADGHLIPVEVTANLFEHAGRLYIVSYTRDVTERKAAALKLHDLELKAALADQTRRYREVFENSSDALFVVDVLADRQFAFDSMNPAAEAAFGLPTGARAGISFDAITAGELGIGFGATLSVLAEHCNTCLATCLPVEFEGQLGLLPGDGTRLFHVKLIPLAGDGGIERIIGIGHDVTERKRAERNHVLLQRALTLSTDPYFLLDERLRIIDANEAACRALGYRREELLKLTPADIDPDIGDDSHSNWLRTVQTDGWSIGARLRRKDGSVLPVEPASVTFEHDGEKFTLALVRDIRLRQRIESTLRFIAQRGWRDSTETFCHSLARFLAEALAVDGIVIARLADDGRSAETVVRFLKGDFSPNICFALEESPCDHVAQESLRYQPNDIRLRYPDSPVLEGVDAESYLGVSLWDSTGRVIGLIAVIDGKPLPEKQIAIQQIQLVAARAAAELERERAERSLRARERDYRTLAENSPDTIIRFDRDCRRIYVSPAYENAYGIATSQVLGRTIRESCPLPADQVDELDSMLHHVLATGTADELTLTTDPTGNREAHTASMRAVPEFDERGEVVSVLTITRDISALKQTERNLIESRSQLQKMAARQDEIREDERRHIARELHEELGQTLSALRIRISTLPLRFGETSPLLTASCQDMLQLVDRTIANLREVIRTLRPTTLDAGIGAALEWLAKDFSQQSGIACDLHLPEESFQLANAPATIVFRIVQEALANINQHANARQVDIRIEHAGDDWHLYISDDGCGFDPPIAGNGFGIPYMREKAFMLGSTLDVASKSGYGTTISMRIPPALAAIPDPEPIAATESNASPILH